jgi:hypothetical protein
MYQRKAAMKVLPLPQSRTSWHIPVAFVFFGSEEGPVTGSYERLN